MERQKRAWNMKKIVQMAAGLVLLLVCVCNVMFDLHAYALEGELAPRFQMKDETIRVGYFEQCSFIERENGKYSGYAVEYLEKIAYYCGWNYEFVEATVEDCFAMLENGEVDLLCGVQYTPERAEHYEYTHIPIGYEYTTVYVNDNTTMYYQDYEAMNGWTVGLIAGSFHSDAFFEIVEKTGISCATKVYDTELEAMHALKAGVIDATVMGSVHLHDGVKVVGRYNVNPFYFIGNKENPKLIETIDDAMQEIRLEAPEFESELTEKYYGSNLVSDGPLFTKKEMEYIANADVIHIRLMEGSVPLSYRKDGEPAGIFVRYLDLLEKYSGLQFEIDMVVTADSMESETAHIPDGNYMMLRSLRAIENGAMEDTLAVSNPILKTKLSYVVRKDAFELIGVQKRRYVLAVTKEMGYIEEIARENGDDCSVKYYNTTQECLKAVAEKEADIAVQDAYVISYALQSPVYAEELTEYPGVDIINGMCLMTAASNEMLLQVLNKTIRFITDSEVEALVTKEILLNPYQFTFYEFIYKNRESFVLAAIAFVIVIVVYGIMRRRMTNLRIRKKEYEILQKKVQEDELTGVYNRQSFYEKARELIRVSNEEMCIVIMDISNFKVVNDLYGMRIGDKLLRHVAKELVRLGEGREGFLVARFTGDHFYLCMKKADFEEIEFPKKFEAFLEDMEVKAFYGVFLVGDQKDIPINIMCDRANIAVHDKEQMQGDYIRYYSEKERERILQEQELENEMEKALESGQFCVFIQPKYDVDTEEIVGGEALVRWRHPQKGMISPGIFIPVFEKNGFILKLDYFVWEETCRLLAEMKRQGQKVYPISINISRAHFYGTELKTRLIGLVEKYGLKPEDLELEITESICAEDTDVIYKRIRRLQTQGFKVSMDDFGSGYSSLNMLKEMPLDIIKMDLKFLDAKENVEKSHLILQTLIALAKTLELKVVVEGVETKEQTEFLKEIGGCYAQGYYFSKPVESEVYLQMVENIKTQGK